MPASVWLFTALSLIVPLFSTVFHDFQNELKKHTPLEILQSYPVFIAGYIFGRILISVAYFTTYYFADYASMYSSAGSDIPIFSQLALLCIDLAFWYGVGSAMQTKIQVKLVRITILSLLEACLLLLLSMIIPVVPDLLYDALVRLY